METYKRNARGLGRGVVLLQTMETHRGVVRTPRTRTTYCTTGNTKYTHTRGVAHAVAHTHTHVERQRHRDMEHTCEAKCKAKPMFVLATVRARLEDENLQKKLS
jgi:hypothetical protein